MPNEDRGNTMAFPYEFKNNQIAAQAGKGKPRISDNHRFVMDGSMPPTDVTSQFQKFQLEKEPARVVREKEPAKEEQQKKDAAVVRNPLEMKTPLHEHIHGSWYG
jgi:hypothetical protein